MAETLFLECLVDEVFYDPSSIDWTKIPGMEEGVIVYPHEEKKEDEQGFTSLVPNTLSVRILTDDQGANSILAKPLSIKSFFNFG